MVFPAIVEEGYAAVASLLHDAYGGRFVRSVAQVVSAHTQGGNLDIGFSELAKRNAVAGILCHRSTGCIF